MAGTGLKTFMLVAGETSGDLLASELVLALREQLPDAKFFGAGGAKMASAGVDLAFDLTQHAVVGITDVLQNYFKFRALFQRLLALAIERKPDVVIGVDYGGFNLRFGHAIKRQVRKQFGHGGSCNTPLHNHLRQGGPKPPEPWVPKIVQFVSPQVWASRPGRAKLLEADYDLLLSIFPFEKAWYEERAPKLKVDFVGHPMLDRIRKPEDGGQKTGAGKTVLLLPGSRKSELGQHLPVLMEAAELIQKAEPDCKFQIVLPDEKLLVGLRWQFAERTGVIYRLNDSPTPGQVDYLASHAGINLKTQIGNLPEALAQADVAIASTGTVTMECAYFGVPTVTLYKKPLLGLALAWGIITVKSLTMPNLLADGEVYPEFIQEAATPEKISQAALELLQNEYLRKKIKSQLAHIIASLGEPGASRRAAAAILKLFP
jgi:lipid-A-disaccharide synthase